MLMIAGIVYVGLNWDEISSQIRSGVDTVDEAKEKAMDMKDNAQEKLDQIQEKIDDTKEAVDDLI